MPIMVNGDIVPPILHNKNGSQFKIIEYQNETPITGTSILPTADTGGGNLKASTNTGLHNLESLEVGVIVGVVIGVCIVLLFAGSVMICFACRKSKALRQRDENGMAVNTLVGDCGNVGCAGSSNGGFFFGRRHVYATMETGANGESGMADNPAGNLFGGFAYRYSGSNGEYFRKPGPPVILPHESVFDYVCCYYLIEYRLFLKVRYFHFFVFLPFFNCSFF